MIKMIKKICSNIAWFYREFTGKCHECKRGYMHTDGEANGDAELLGLSMKAHCSKCGSKRFI